MSLFRSKKKTLESVSADLHKAMCEASAKLPVKELSKEAVVEVAKTLPEFRRNIFGVMVKK